MTRDCEMNTGSRAAILLALCVAGLAAAADSSADAVMLKKPKSVPAPTHSFLLDVAPVKEVKEEPKKEEAKPAAAEKPAPEVAAAQPKVEEAKKEPEVKPAAQTKEEEPVLAAWPAPKVEAVQPKAEETKPAPKVEAPKVEETKKEDVKPVVKVEKKAAKEDGKDAKENKAAKGEKKAAKEKKEKAPARDAIITADRTDYDRKEGVVLFDRNVHVDDTQYQMHADRLFLFLEGTNELKRLVAIGHVAITNEDKRAYCHRATFNKKLGRVVMYSGDEITAELREEGKKGSDVRGERITFWLDSEQVEVDNPVITMPGGIGGQGSVKKLIGK